MFGRDRQPRTSQKFKITLYETKGDTYNSAHEKQPKKVRATGNNFSAVVINEGLRQDLILSM